MMNRKVLLVAGILAFSAPFGALAGDKHQKDLVSTLNLQGEKAEQVEDVMSRYDDQAEQIKERAKDQMNELRDQKEEQLKAILTEAEFDRYESMKESKKEMKEKWAEKCGKDKDENWLGMVE